MKKNLLLIFLSMFSFILFAQENVSNCNYNDSIFTVQSSEMTFDLNKYKVHNNKGEIVVLDNDKYNYTIKIDSSEIFFNKINKILKIDKTIYYYPNGKIKRNYIYYKPNKESTNSKIAVSKKYNLEGEIYEAKNYDKGYKICYSQVIPITKKIIGAKKIKKYELKFSVGRSDLNEFPDGIAKWYISVEGNDEFQKKIKPSHSYTYVIDGVTGKLRGILKNRIDF